MKNSIFNKKSLVLFLLTFCSSLNNLWASTQTFITHNKQYQIEKTNTTGTQSQVLLAKESKSQMKVAIKVPYSHRMDQFRNEISVIEKLPSHPNFIKILEFRNDFQYNYIIMERGLGNLSDFLDENGDKLATQTKKSLLYSLAQGLYYLHSLGYAHKDFTIENILVVQDSQNPNYISLKISDFGLATKVGPYDSSSFAEDWDMYSFILGNMFDDSSDFNESYSDEELTIKELIKDPSIDALKQLLEHPDLKGKDVLKHPWFKI